MTLAERNNKLKHFITCLKCEVSGKCCDDNCSVQYDAGNMGEIIENLEAISRALEQEPILDKIEEEIKDTLYVDSLIFTELIDFKNGKIDADDVIEEFNRVTRMEVLKIIDKYRAESEG